MRIEAVLFDIDGTLVDSNEAHVEAWATAFREAGRPLPDDAIRAQIGKGSDILVPTLLPDADDAVREAIAQRHGDRFKAEHLDRVRAFPDAGALVRRVHDGGRRVVLASSAKRNELDHYVALLGIGDVVHAASSADDVESSKPEPDIFGVALERAGVPADAAIAIGDTPYDAEAAGRAGIATIGLLSGPFDEARLREAGAIAVYADVAALLADFDRSPLAR